MGIPGVPGEGGKTESGCRLVRAGTHGWAEGVLSQERHAERDRLLCQFVQDAQGDIIIDSHEPYPGVCTEVPDYLRVTFDRQIVNLIESFARWIQP